MAEKKEFAKIEEAPIEEKPSGLSAKLAGALNKSFSVLKFAMGICLLPMVYAVSLGFVAEFDILESSIRTAFWAGVITFALIYLFVWEPAIIYTKGQKLLEFLFSFFKPMVRVAPYLLPIYTIVLFIIFGILVLFVKPFPLVHEFVFLFGLSMGLHIVFGAKSIRSKKNDFLKANYIFGFSFVYILNVLLLGLCFNLIFEKFSFVNFFNNSFQLAKNVFHAVFKQLFL